VRTGGDQRVRAERDLAARALEIKADVLAKGTRVDGVYDKDPLRHEDAIRFAEVDYTVVLSRSLAVMDASAVAMGRDNRLPIVVFNLNTSGNIMRMSRGEPLGTVITAVPAKSEL